MKYNTETFIEKAKEIHGDKYDYSLSEYKKNHLNVSIICKKHGVFKQIPANHTRKTNPHGCPNCASNKKLTTKTFIEKAKEIHGDKYDYSLVKYIGAHDIIKIICLKHGIFEQKAFAHLQNYGCQICGNNKKLTKEIFIKKAKEIHGDKYDYSLSEYKNSHTKIKIICPKHGIFEQKPNNHLSKQDCYKCGEIIRSNNKILKAKNSFIEKAKKTHGDKYDYSLVKYINCRSKIKIICLKHGIFKQSPHSHINNHGCPDCYISKGEFKIKEILNNKNINFIFQKSFDNCKNENNKKLKFDFYLPKQNILIEYDGKQHYEPIEYFGGLSSFKITNEYDNIKNNYAKNNNIKLIRIPYYKYKIINKILNFL
jgi:hypothetical protein